MKHYVIVMLCKDDSNVYNDIVNMLYTDLRVAKEDMKKCMFNELNELRELEDKYYSVVSNDSMSCAIYNTDDELITDYEIYVIDKEK